jgi:predicted nucleotidyltransferase
MRTSRSGQSALLLLDVVDVLASHKVEYAVIGALAASIHGAVRASMDADAVLSLGLHEAGALERAFKAAQFHTELTRGDFEDPVPGLLRLSDGFGNRVDLLIGLRGLETQAFSRAVEVPFQGKTLKFIGREDFIAMKVFAGGPVDIADAARAISAAGKSLDVELSRRLAARYGREATATLDRLLAQ